MKTYYTSRYNISSWTKHRMKKILKKYTKTLVFLLLICGFLVWMGSFIFSYDRIFEKGEVLIFHDVSRINPEKVLAVDSVKTTSQIQSIIKEANEKWLKVSIAWSRHSQGWHTYYKDSVVIDMRNYNKILKIDKANKLLTVQAWATWDDIQRYINPYGLSVKVMQSSNIFTVWWSMSANVHGRDIESTSIINTVQSFRLLTASGEILDVSRENNSELFPLVIGWYGLFWVILDATFSLIENDLYEGKAILISHDEFPKYFSQKILTNTWITMMMARPSITSWTFLNEIVVNTWELSLENKTNAQTILTEEENIWRDKLFFWLSRSYEWGKDLRWYLQKKIELPLGKVRVMTRNNAMRPPQAPIEFLDYYAKNDTDILQEYFIPTSKYSLFTEEMKRILQENAINTLSFTVRYVRKSSNALLSYCPNEDCFSIILLTNVWLDKGSQRHTEEVTRKIVDAALAHSWSYYLTYQLYPTQVQLKKAYPNFDLFISAKKKYDPNEIFINSFYKKYEK